ncbi:hypothetical protein ACFU5D_27990 [Streptomyces anthocyanicus]|uniref:hypothetical protein n=1 Tax=Streptomyces anthocyanicus TaxID=68174 RepID=UPI0001B503DB
MLSRFVLGAGQADLQAFDRADPALALSFGNPVKQVVADLDQAISLRGFRPKERASDASMLVNA